jgi:hypothetical protein
MSKQTAVEWLEQQLNEKRLKHRFPLMNSEPLFEQAKQMEKEQIEEALFTEVTMSKQTAVNQIFAQIKAARKDTKFWSDSMLVDWLLEQEEGYKQMEKEQIEIAFAKSYLISCEEVSYNDANKASENYYGETYGGNNE